MNTKLTKTLLTILVASIALGSLTYLARTVLDIGCANTGTSKEVKMKRHFLGANCWYWERTIQLQSEV